MAHRLRARTRTRAEVKVRPRPLVKQATEHTKRKSNRPEHCNTKNTTTATTTNNIQGSHNNRTSCEARTQVNSVQTSVTNRKSRSVTEHAATLHVGLIKSFTFRLMPKLRIQLESRQAASIGIDGLQDELHCLLGSDDKEPRRAWCQPLGIAVMQQFHRIIEDHASEQVTFAHRSSGMR